MTFDSHSDDIPIPEAWPQSIHSALIHIVSMTHWAIVHTRSWCANSPISRVRLAGELQSARDEIALLREEIRIKDIRMAKIQPRHRPHYPPTERMAILQLKASQGWNIRQTGIRFMLEEDTIAMWLRRVEDRKLHSMGVPVNRFPDFVGHVVRRLKVLCPSMGKKRIAETLSRAGLQLSASSVGRFIRPRIPRRPEAPPHSPSSARVVTARNPNHVWHVDLTVMPARGGFSSTWFPWALPPRWPFGCWIAVVVDHFSRRAIAFALFSQAPSSVDIRRFLGRAMSRVKSSPRHLVCDRGKQFDCHGFRQWCKRRGIRYRYGAVGRHGSIAIVERFIRSMKNECLRIISAPTGLEGIRKELALYFAWYNQFRPHQGLAGRTPMDVYSGIGREGPRYVSGQAIPELTLRVSYCEGRKHLPRIELERAA